jgi:hypothetical protein
MALVISSSGDELFSAKKTRIIQIEAKEPGDKDKITLHKLDVEYQIIDRDLWKSMSDRWDELNQKALRAHQDKDTVMTDDEIAEMREPIYQIAAPYINSIGPLMDENKQPVEFTDAIKDALLKQPWLQPPLGDGFMAAQRGLTVADFKKLRAKNS